MNNGFNVSELRKTIGPSYANLPPFFHPAYADWLRENGKKLMLASFQGSLMPFEIYNLKFLTLARILHPPLRNGNRLSEEEELTFLDIFLAWSREKKIIQRIVQPPTYCIFHSLPEKSTGAEFGTYVLSLENKSEEELIKGIHSKHRNRIRFAERAGVNVAAGNSHLHAFYELYRSTMERSSMFCESKMFFDNMLKALDSNTLCLVAYSGNTPLAAAIILYSNYAGYYLYGASSVNMEVPGAMNLLQWEIIRFLKSKGTVRYDFVGSRIGKASEKHQRIQFFKERFGGPLDKGFLWKMDIDPIRCMAFDVTLTLKMALKGKRRMKDIIDQELDKE